MPNCEIVLNQENVKMTSPTTEKQRPLLTTSAMTRTQVHVRRYRTVTNGDHHHLLKRKETLSKTKINYQQMAVQLEHVSGLAKTHKAYANLTSLRPIFITTSTSYYNIVKFLSFSATINT